ncbi:hypothetical protein AACH06_11715 [Ideonella sp. DXS29W]|uniref:Uncharacterized protein n=1 Tax=Ideonella lacteola TaxID=2984193 RepID=A0ABU9BNZ3_9BURK
MIIRSMRHLLTWPASYRAAGLFIRATAALLAWLSLAAHAQTSAGIDHPAYCRLQADGLAQGVKTLIDRKAPRTVVMDELGLRRDGPRFRMADLAYQRLLAGAPLAAVRGELQQLCLTIPRAALEQDDPTFGQRQEGAGAQLCADLGSSVADFLLDEPGMMDADVATALQRMFPGESTGASMPQLRQALQAAQAHARANPDRMKLTSFVAGYCERLPPTRRAALDAEFYAK